MTKYTRHQFINRQSDSEYAEDHWLRKFEENLQKSAVQPNRGESLFDQINSIINGKSAKYPSVQAAVDDMMHRSGLTDYLTKKVSEQDPKDLATKTAQHRNDLPKIMQEKPSVLHTLENIIQDSRGNLSITSIIDRLRSLHNMDIPDESMWDDEDLIRFVSKCNLQAKKDNPASYDNYTNLGRQDRGSSSSETDPSNTDAFHALMPNKI